MSKINRRAVLAGAASAAVTAPAIAASAEPDPIFAAIEAYKFNLAAFLARCHYEDELAEKGIKLAAAPDDYRTPEMVAPVRLHRTARRRSAHRMRARSRTSRSSVFWLGLLLLAAALAQPTDEPSDHERGQQERDDHAHADEHIGENDSGAALRWSWRP